MMQDLLLVLYGRIGALTSIQEVVGMIKTEEVARATLLRLAGPSAALWVRVPAGCTAAICDQSGASATR